jgi:hypothetical protein
MSDVYSLSMVIVEVCLFSLSAMLSSSIVWFQLATGKVPFPEYADHSVIVMILKGKRPLKPRPFDAPGMTPEVWRIAQKCWLEEAEERLEVNAVLKSLSNSGV